MGRRDLDRRLRRDRRPDAGLAARSAGAAVARPLRRLLLGWGALNLVEGVIDHHILVLHHVRDELGAPLGWDLGFLALGLALVPGGWMLVASGRRLTSA